MAEIMGELSEYLKANRRWFPEYAIYHAGTTIRIQRQDDGKFAYWKPWLGRFFYGWGRRVWRNN